MRKVIYGAACSLDGFITAGDGSLDWLHFSSDVQKVMADFWPRVDTVLMGRKTFDVALQNGGAGGGSSDMRSFVFSRTLKSSPQPGVQLVSDDAGGFVRQLKQQPGKDICLMGGGDFARSLFEAGVVDEVGLNIHPVLLGSGVPMFGGAMGVKLELVENRTIDGGCVLTTYRVM